MAKLLGSTACNADYCTNRHLWVRTQAGGRDSVSSRIAGITASSFAEGVREYYMYMCGDMGDDSRIG